MDEFIGKYTPVGTSIVSTAAKAQTAAENDSKSNDETFKEALRSIFYRVIDKLGNK